MAAVASNWLSFRRIDLSSHNTIFLDTMIRAGHLFFFVYVFFLGAAQAWTHNMMMVATLPSREKMMFCQPPSSSVSSRRHAFETLAAVSGLVLLPTAVLAANTNPTIDVNNALAREYTAFPGLYPTVATKIVNGAKEEPFTSKKQVYALLNEVEQERLRQYDKFIIIQKPDKALQQFKTSQICKYECGSRTSNSYRNDQIRAVQAARARP